MLREGTAGGGGAQMNTTPRPTASEKLCAGQIESAPISQRSPATGLRSSAVSASFIIAINEIRRRQSADFVAFFLLPMATTSTQHCLCSHQLLVDVLQFKKKRETQQTDGVHKVASSRLIRLLLLLTQMQPPTCSRRLNQSQPKSQRFRWKMSFGSDFTRQVPAD